MTTTRPRLSYNVELIAADVALRGWNNSDLARASSRSVQTISRFMRRDGQTAKVANDIAEALGYTVERYLERADAAPSTDERHATVPSSPGTSRDSQQTERRRSDADRRQGGRRRTNRLMVPDRRKDTRREQ